MAGGGRPPHGWGREVCEATSGLGEGGVCRPPYCWGRQVCVG